MSARNLLSVGMVFAVATTAVAVAPRADSEPRSLVEMATASVHWWERIPDATAALRALFGTRSS